MAGEVHVPPVAPAELAAVAAVAPLALGLTMRAGPFEVPVGLMAGAGRVEHEESEVGGATREFLREDPWSGMGSVHPGGWMLLARDDDTIVIGQRRDEVGLGPVVTLIRSGDRFEATAMGGVRLVTRRPHERVEPVLDATVDGASVVVSWDRGADSGRHPLRQVADVRTAVAADAVHVLLVSAPVGPPRTGWQVSTGMTARATLHLDDDLGGRPLYSDHTVPGARLPLR
ncbi:hypothetical protein ACXR2U_15665 [Jatrophihabitans sp. YIM 134969]